jgi:hypothetical protein
MHCFLEKALQSTTFWMNFTKILFPFYIVWLRMLFLVIVYLLERFKVKLIDVSNKNAYVVHFLMKSLY